MEHLHLQPIIVFLVVAGVIVPLAKQLKISPVLGFLTFGLLIGPFGVARFADEYFWLQWVTITDLEGVRTFAELGVIFLLFTVGLELSAERLWAMRRYVFGFGGLQIVLTATLIGVIASLFDNSWPTAVVLGACLALSSTAMVLQLLTEQGRFGTSAGRGVFSVLLAQDIAVVPILFLVSALAATDGEPMLLTLATSLGIALFAVTAIFLLGRLIVRPLFGMVSAAKGPELFVAATLLIIIAASAITELSGLSAALGAFLAGLLFSETEYRYEIEISIEPFRGLLLGLFFMSIGMSVDLAAIWADPVWIVLSVFGLMALKSLIAGGLALLFGFSRSQALEIGLLLSQGGEFAFIVIAMATINGLFVESTAQFMLIVVSATMFLTPLVARVARSGATRLKNRALERQLPQREIADTLADHAIIVGYGRTGQLIARLLNAQHMAHVALDLNAARVGRLREKGAPVYYGDATRPMMLRKVALKKARLLVLSMDNPDAAKSVLRAARDLAPKIPILVRAHDVRHGDALMEMGATQVIPEVLEAGLHLGQLALVQLGMPVDTARDVVELERDELASSKFV